MTKRNNRFRIFLITVTIILAVVQVLLLNSLSTYGAKLNKLDEKIREISTSNDFLTEQIASESSVLAISTRATALGLTTNLTALNLLGPVPVALSNLSSN